MADVLGEAVVVVGADTTGFQGDLTNQVAQTKRSLAGLGTDMQAVGKKLSFSLTAPLAGVAGFAVKTQADFEQTMNVLAANTNATAKEMANLDSLAKQLGADTVFSAGEASQAMLELAKGGFKPAQIAGGGVQAVMALAATEGLDLAAAAEIAGNAMNTFGLEAKNAASIADALAGGSMASSASVQSLAMALSQVGPGARNAGLNIQDTVGVLSAFASAGIQGSDAGTSLKTMLTRLVPTTKKAKDEMRDLGLSFVDSKGNIDDITTVAGKLRDKLAGLSQEQRTQALATIFGSDATRAATVLMNQGEAGIRRYIKATKEQGTAQKLAEARMEGTAGAIEKMKGSLETAALAAGEALAPTVIKLAGKIEDLTDKFTNLDPEVQQTVVALAAAAAAAGPLLFIGGSLFRTVGMLATGFTTTSTALAAFSTNMTTATGRATILQGTMAKLGAASKGAAGLAGIAALTASTMESDAALAGLEKTAGGALAGFAVGGPWGAAIGAAVGGFSAIKGALAEQKEQAKKAAFANQSLLDQADQLKQTNYDYAASLDAATGALTRKTKAQARDNLVADGTLEAARTIGISTRDIVAAAAGNADATDRVYRAYKRLYNQALNTGNLSNVVATKNAFDQISRSLHINAEAVQASRRAIRQQNSDLMSTKEALRGLDKRVVLEVTQKGFEPTIGRLRALKKQFDLTDEELNLIIKETGADGVIVKAGKVRRALDDVGKADPKLDLFLGGVSNATGAAERTARTSAAKIKDTLLLDDVRANLGKLAPSLAQGLAGVEKTASSGGANVGDALKNGLLAGFAGAEQALGARMESAVVNAIRRSQTAAQIASPSKKTTYIGEMLGQGYAVGLDKTANMVASSAANLIQQAVPSYGGSWSLPVRPTRAPSAPSPASSPTASPLAPETGAGDLTVNFNEYGPRTGADRLQDLDWTLRYATGRTPVQVTAGVGA